MRPAGSGLIGQVLVGAVKEMERVDANNFTRGVRLAFANSPGIFARKVLKAPFARGEEDHRNVVTAIGMQAKRASTANGLIVRMWGNDEQIHLCARNPLLRQFTCARRLGKSCLLLLKMPRRPFQFRSHGEKTPGQMGQNPSYALPQIRLACPDILK